MNVNVNVNVNVNTDGVNRANDGAHLTHGGYEPEPELEPDHGNITDEADTNGGNDSMKMIMKVVTVIISIMGIIYIWLRPCPSSPFSPTSAIDYFSRNIDTDVMRTNASELRYLLLESGVYGIICEEEVLRNEAVDGVFGVANYIWPHCKLG
ncbi:hypothetical protein FRX31_008156 [Thalictrum thalictroides]|uniref:Uncharacterized protein n=1 Tax=Thalictrum thalictroides TaxID=46969 RepID=A0A7J6WZI7_THATH|nr:hypothetical protein FRX31_008156 [Thalictrum thalictroides]